MLVIMPRNTLSILIRFQKTVTNLNCTLLASQDVILLNMGVMPTSVKSLFDLEDMKLETDYEGDPTKVFLNYDNPEEMEDAQKYSQGLSERCRHYTEFLKQANLKSLQPVRVLHCPQAHGIVVESNYGRCC